MLPVATTARVLPEHVDLTIVLTASGLGAFATTVVGVLRRHDGERLRRLALLGSMAGGIFGVVYWMLALIGAIR